MNSTQRVKLIAYSLCFLLFLVYSMLPNELATD